MIKRRISSEEVASWLAAMGCSRCMNRSPEAARVLRALLNGCPVEYRQAYLCEGCGRSLYDIVGAR